MLVEMVAPAARPPLYEQLQSELRDRIVDALRAAVPRVVEHDEPARGPPPGQPPRRLHRAADVVTPVDEHAGDPVESVGVAKQLTVVQEPVVAPVVGDQAGESQWPSVVRRRVPVPSKLVIHIWG